MPITVKQQVKTFKDFDLTFQLNPLTKDVNTLTDSNAIDASIRNLILTMNYERPFHPEIGCPAYGLLFEPATAVISNILETIITQELATFEPRAQLNFVDVDAQPDQNAYAITINYSIVNYFQPFTVTVLLQRLR